METMKGLKDMKPSWAWLRARRQPRIVFMPCMSFMVIVVGAALTAFTTHHVEG